MKRRFAEAIMRRELHILDMGQGIVLCTKASTLQPPSVIKSIGESAEMLHYCNPCVTELLERVSDGTV